MGHRSSSKDSMENFGWFITLEELVKVRNQPWEEILYLNVIEFLNSLSYLKAKNENQKRELKNLKKKYKRNR